jgi:hypothetical protein
MTVTQPTTTTTLDLIESLTGLAATEVTNAEAGEKHETVEVGPIAGTYLRLRAPDILVAVKNLEDLLDRVADAVMDARHDKMMAERRRCPGCPALIDPDEQTCGDPRCDRELAQDTAGLR